MQPVEPIVTPGAGRLPNMASRAARKQKSPKQRIANLEEFVSALLALVLKLADELEPRLGTALLRKEFPNRERFSASAQKGEKNAVHPPR